AFQLGAEDFPRPQYGPGRDAGVDDIPSVVAGIVPSADIVAFSGLPGGRVKFSSQVTCRVCEPGEFRPQVYSRATALAVESAHGQIVCAGENIRPDRERPALPHSRHVEIVSSRVAQLGEVGNLNGVAGVRVQAGWSE